MHAPVWAAQEPWVAILVMVLSAGFWIVSNLFKALAQPPKQVNQGGRALPGGPPNAGAMPMSLEAFLQEARRRREEAEASQYPQPEPLATRDQPQPGDRNKEKRRKNRKGQPNPARNPAIARKAMPPPEQQVPVAEVVPDPIPMDLGREAPALLRRTERAPVADFLASALAKAHGVQACLVLGEVLGSPRCRRPFRPASAPRRG